MPDQTPPELREAFEVLNSGRVDVGLPGYVWDDRLYRAEQERCEYLWNLLIAGTGCPTCNGHWDVEGRMRRAGWPLSNIAPPGARIPLNEAECVMGGAFGGSGPRDHCGWSWPECDPAREVRTTVEWFRQQVESGHIGPHCADFLAGYNRAAIGHHHGMCSMVYGYLP